MHLFLAITISITVPWLLHEQRLWHKLLPNLELHSVNTAKLGGPSDRRLNIVAAANATSLMR
jgi:hypothetical protein